MLPGMFSSISQMTSKRVKNKKVAHEAQQMDKIHVNPLAPKSDQHLISP